MKPLFRLLAVVLTLSVVACGGSGPSSPTSGVTSSKTNKGTVTAVIDGASFNGTVTAALNVAGVFSVGSSNAGNTITLGFGALSGVGTTTVGPISPTNATLTIPTSSASPGWAANTSGGSGTLTVTTFSATGASGTFSFTLIPVPGTGATGNKVVTSGTFNVTF